MRPRLNTGEIAKLLLLAAAIFGTLFRLWPAWLAGFPVNDGGMFYVMMRDLQSNRFVPPPVSSYNQMDIPFAYPPLALYLGALIARLTGLPMLVLLAWLPGVLNALTLWPFYLLAVELLGDRLKGSAATLAFALIPHTSTWLSMGGGLTRSTGMFFMLWTILYAHQLLRTNERASLWKTMAFGGLTVLSHTEAPVYAALAVSAMLACRFRSPAALRSALAAGAGAALLGGAWYAWIFYGSGPAAFQAAAQTGLLTSESALRILDFDFLTEEPYLDMFGVLGLAGLLFLLARRDHLIPAMLGAFYAFLPRSAHSAGDVPVALAIGALAGEGLAQWRMRRASGPTSNISVGLPVLIVISLAFANAVGRGFQSAGHRVPAGELEAMRWVAEHTPPEASFLVITGEQNGFCDAVDEWFPALTSRQSRTTLQGREWIAESSFTAFLRQRARLQACIDEDGACLLSRESGELSGAGYIYISIRTPTSSCGPSSAAARETRGLIQALEASPDFEAIFRSDAAAIFKRR